MLALSSATDHYVFLFFSILNSFFVSDIFKSLFSNVLICYLAVSNVPLSSTSEMKYNIFHNQIPKSKAL